MKLTFQTKVIVPVVVLLTVFLAVIVWLVNGRITEQLEEESRSNLETAEAVLKNSLQIRERNLLLRYQSLANEPRFKAVAQLADPKTMTAQLRELLNEIGSDAKVMVFTTNEQSILAAVKSDPQIDISKFHTRIQSSVNHASQGRSVADIVVVGPHLLNSISVPVLVNDALAGVLTIGHSIGDPAAQELRSLTHSEIIFLVGGKGIVSTLSDPGLLPETARIFNRLRDAAFQRTEFIVAGGQHFLCLGGWLSESRDQIGYLLFSSYETALRRKEETQSALLMISFAGIVLSSLLLFVLIRKITHPLRQLRDSAEAVGKGDFSHRVSVASRDECGELATVFNQMTSNLQTSQAEIQNAMQSLKDTQAQLIQTEKLSAMGKFVAGIAHELSNPLTGIIGFSQMLQESGINEHQDAFLQRITGSAERCRQVVQNLLSFSRRHRPERKPVDINDLVASSVEILKYELDSNNVEVVEEFGSNLPPAMMDPHQMQQVFLNIINNARQAVANRTDGHLWISTALVNGGIQIRFRDDGHGIKEDDLPNIFNPFFSTKPVGEGTGLGLSLSYGIVQEHGGTIHAESKPGQGATFIIDLPLQGI